MDAQQAAIVAVVAVAPLAIVLVIALLRGYTFDIHLTRKRRDDDETKR